MNVDAIIIGAGQAGPALAGRLTAAGKKVVFVERSHLGGTCVNTGCIPTKTLVASARVAHVARRAAEFGVKVSGPVSVDMKRVKARKDEVVLGARNGLGDWLASMNGLTLVRGHARLEGNHRVRVGDDVYKAEHIYLDVGARPRIPPFAEGLPVWTSTEMMEVDAVPDHLVVVGGGAIGLEFAQMYRRFGAEVTVVEMKAQILPREDPEVAQHVQRVLEGEGVRFRTAAECVALSHEAGRFRVRLDCEDEPKELTASNVLVAVGRTPNTDDLGLETTDLNTDDRGYLPVNDTLESNVPGIWVLGEVNRRGAFTHTSYNDFEIVAENLLDGASRKVTDRIPIYGVFVDPPLARVGMSMSQAKASGKKVLRGYRPMRRVGRAIERSETAGFISILVDGETQRLLGATLLGIEADEAIHCLADLMYANAPVETLRRAVHIHPTVSELLPTVVGSLEPL